MTSKKRKKKRNLGRYRSSLEKAFAEATPRKFFEYEPYRLEYSIPKKYLPDFAKGDILIECKGFFRAGDTQKYKAIRDSLLGRYEVVFLLSDPYKKVRKGSKLTMGEWCTREGFAYFTMEEVEELMEYVNNKGTD